MASIVRIQDIQAEEIAELLAASARQLAQAQASAVHAAAHQINTVKRHQDRVVAGAGVVGPAGLRIEGGGSVQTQGSESALSWLVPGGQPLAGGLALPARVGGRSAA